MNNNERFIELASASMSPHYSAQVLAFTEKIIAEYPEDRQDYCYLVAHDHFSHIFDHESKREEGSEYEQFFADVWGDQLRNVFIKNSTLAPSWLIDRQ